MERTSESAQLPEKDLVQEMKKIDKIRSQIRDIVSGNARGQHDSYPFTIKTSDWNIKDLAPAVANFANNRFGRKL